MKLIEWSDCYVVNIKIKGSKDPEEMDLNSR